MTTYHASFTIKRTYDAPAARVFAAWSNPQARARWGVPAGDAVQYERTDFRVGGQDISACGPANELGFHVVSTYYDIVESERIVFGETIDHVVPGSTEGTRLGVTLISVEFADAGSRTRLALNAHVVGLDSRDMIEGSQAGWGECLDQLAAELAREPATA
jgi:uncharacterized protein YndB with AHSA1/START domain